MIEIVLIVACGVCGWLGAYLVRHHAEKVGLISDPTHRSSHTIPTPHGGGVGIAAAVVLSFPVLEVFFNSSVVGGYWWLGLGVCLAGAVVSFVDDFRHVPAGIRLLVHLGLCCSVVYNLHPLAEANFYFFEIGGLFLSVLVCLVLLWWVNLYNFMDGIDGLAATQSIYMLLCGAGIVVLRLPAFSSEPVFWLSLSVAASTFGFLLLNWPPAKVFMGDVGSVLLAMVIAFVTLYTIKAGWAGYHTWLILGASFITDASYMLFLRVLRREKLHVPHRNHAYQRLSRCWKGHRPVTVFFLLVNVFWLTPLALLTLYYPIYCSLIVLVAYLPLLAGCIYAQKNLD